VSELVQSNTTTTLTPSANPAVYGQEVTLTAVVASTTTGTPHGTVTFKEGSSTLGTATLSGGIAALTLDTLAVGTDDLTAVFGGGPSFLSSTSAVVAEQIDQAATTTVLSASPNPGVYGAAVTLTAVVTSSTTGTPAGTVTFKSGSSTLGAATLSGGTATLTIHSLDAGADSLTAVYDGAPKYLTSTSAAVAEVIDAAPTTLVLTATPSPATEGTEVTLTATITSSTGGVPAGSITFKNGAATLGSAALVSGVATFTTTALPVGTDSLTAVWGGGPKYQASKSAAVAEVINP
jgi:large repetitive protein